jgi:hypothetical protein
VHGRDEVGGRLFGAGDGAWVPDDLAGVAWFLKSHGGRGLGGGGGCGLPVPFLRAD